MLSRDCVHFLKSDGELWTPEREEEQDFASAVAMALRRYERQGPLEVVGKDGKTQACVGACGLNPRAPDRRL